MKHYLDNINKGFMEPRAANHIPLTPLSFLPRIASIYPKRDAVIYGKRKYNGRRSTNGRCVWQVQSKMLV